MPWCPKCGAEYREGFTECSECRAPLTDEMPDSKREEQERVLPSGMKQPVVIHTAANALEASTVCDYLREHDVVVLDRPAAFRQAQAYSGADARFGVEIVVDVSQTARARQLIEELNENLNAAPVDEDELARLAEEQAVQMPEQPMEDNTSFKMMPMIVGVIALALVLLYFITR